MLGYYENLLVIPLKLLSIIGLNPLTATLKSQLLACAIFTCAATDLLLASIFTLHSYQNFANFVLTLSINVKIVGMGITLIWKKQELAEFIEDLERLWPLDYGGTSEEIQNGCLKFLRLTGLFTKCTASSFIVSCICATILLFLTKSSIVLSYVQYFFHTSSYIPTIIDVPLMYYYTLIVCGFDALLTSNVILFCVQFKILNANLKSALYYKRENERTKAECWKIVRKYKIHHEFLLKSFEKLSEIYGMIFLIDVWLSVMVICFSLYNMSLRDLNIEQTFLFMVLALACWAEMLLFHFIPIQFLNNDGNQVAESLYQSDWYETADSSLKKSLGVIMVRAQKENVLMAGKLIPMNFETCTSIFKTIMSFTAFLRNVAK